MLHLANHKIAIVAFVGEELLEGWQLHLCVVEKGSNGNDCCSQQGYKIVTVEERTNNAKQYHRWQQATHQHAYPKRRKEVGVGALLYR